MAGRNSVKLRVGFMTKRAPIKAVTRAEAENRVGLSPRMNMLRRRDANGDILFSMAASEMFMWPMA